MYMSCSRNVVNVTGSGKTAALTITLHTVSLFRSNHFWDTIFPCSFPPGLTYICIWMDGLVCVCTFHRKETNVNQSNSEGNISFFFLFFWFGVFRFAAMQCVKCTMRFHPLTYNKFFYITHVAHGAKILFALVKYAESGKRKCAGAKRFRYIHFQPFASCSTHTNVP